MSSHNAPPPQLSLAPGWTACVLGIFALGVLSCVNPVVPEMDEGQPASAARPALSSCTKGSFAGFSAYWDCGNPITIRDNTGTAGPNLSVAVDAWNAKIFASGITGMPYFQYVTTLTADVSVVGASGGEVWCDASTNTTITLYSGSSCDSYTNSDTRLNVLIHALAHVYGWPSNTHKKGESGASDHCAIHLPDDGSINPTVCAHEIEGAAAAYGLRTLDDETFWETPFATGFAGAFGNQTITVGGTHQYSLSWEIDGQGSTAGPVAFQSLNTPVATVSSSGLVTGVSVGSASISATSGSSTTYLRTFAFENQPVSATVTVNPAPLVDLVVQDITVDASLPLFNYGDRTWTAVMGSGDTTGVSYRWVVEYSWSSPPDSVFVPVRSSSDSALASPWGYPPFAARTWQGTVTNGSYNIRVKVWPARGDSVGMPAIRDFPVCPDSSHQWLMALRDEEVMAICPY